MSNRNAIFQSAVAGILVLGLAQVADAQDTGSKEKCYGIAKAGKNDCGTPRHTCAGKSTRDNSPEDWKYVTKGTCAQAGGKSSAGGPDAGKAPKYFAY